MQAQTQTQTHLLSTWLSLPSPSMSSASSVAVSSINLTLPNSKNDYHLFWDRMMLWPKRQMMFLNVHHDPCALGPPNMYIPPVTLTERCLCIFPWFFLLYVFSFLFELNWLYILFQREFLRLLLVLVLIDQGLFFRHYLAISRRHGISFRFGHLFSFGATKFRGGGGGRVKTGWGDSTGKKTNRDYSRGHIYIYLSN